MTVLAPADSVWGMSLRALVLVVICGCLAGVIAQGLDSPVQRYAQAFGATAFGHAWARAAYWMGLGGVQIAFCVVLGLWAHFAGKAWWRRLALDSFLAVAISGLGVQVIKHLVGRPRPRMNQPLWQDLGPSFDSDMHSFPSGHTATSFALAALLSRRFPALSPIFYTLAGFISFGRLLGNSHYLSDALGGMCLGLMVGWFLAMRAARRETA